MCGTALPPNISTSRPNIRFDYCTPSINNYSIAWTPSTGADKVSNPAIANPTTNPINTTLYTIHLGGSGGCGGQASVTVQVDTSTMSVVPNISICPGSSTELVATLTGTVIPGPPVFTWTTLAGGAVGTGDSVSVSPTANTTYVVTMTGGACTKTDTVKVSLTGLTVTLLDSMVSCKGGSNGKILASANGTGTYTYAWSPPAGNINPDINLAAGNYSVTVTDAGGCSGSATTTITQTGSLPTIPNQVINNVTCNGGNNGSITITPSGGTGQYSYQWSNSLPAVNHVSNLTAGNYSVTVTDANGCTVTAAIAVPQPLPITFTAPTVQNVRCLNGNTGKITVYPSGGAGAPYTYSWNYNSSLNSATAQNLAAGTYMVTATDVKGCTGIDTIVITQPANGITFSAFATTAPACFGGNNGTATVNVTGGTTPYGYLWSANANNQITQTATALPAGTYTVTVSDDSLCTASATVSVTQPAQIQIAGTVINDSCHGNSNGSITIVVTNGAGTLSYQWSNTATTQNIANLVAGPYTVTATDANGCTQTASFTVSQPVANYKPCCNQRKVL